jgi:hypothetical protein
MKYNNFKSIVASRKQSFEMRNQTDSFFIAKKRAGAYIEPTFTKSVFDVEKPKVVLVSAVGATGKSALAQVLSNDLNLPLLDLGKHKPVGDNSLTGLLTGAFAIEQLSAVFGGIASGGYGVIIDGIDEGRSKTTEHAFNAFLDDIVGKLSADSTAPSFVLLGRTQVLEECWLYFTSKEITTGLVTINPFDLDQARAYIDAFTTGRNSAQAAQYDAARDLVLTKLSSAFGAVGTDAPPGNFISFIGYPPVLDSIVTLLENERNYHRLTGQLSDSGSGNLEIELLYKIAAYILERERTEKVIPNIVTLLAANFAPVIEPVRKTIFDVREQCIRLVAHCIGKPAALIAIKSDAAVNLRYEEQLAPFLAEHPFITGQNFRNAIFEAVAISTLVAGDEVQQHSLALEYLDSRRHSHYLIYFLSLIARNGRVPRSCLRCLLGSALEFKAPGASVELSVIANEYEELAEDTTVDVEIDLAMGVGGEQTKTFSFTAQVSGSDSLELGSRLSSAYVSVPCEAILGAGTKETELTAPIEIRASALNLRSEALVLRTTPTTPAADRYINLEAQKIESAVTGLENAGVQFSVAVEDTSGLRYPLVQIARKKSTLPKDPLLIEKYLRLRKILTHFRSHSKGALAKYRHKIENPRVAGNPLGEAVLRRLVTDGVLYLDGPMYFLNPDEVDKYLGVSWIDLRQGHTTPKLLEYLAGVSA